MRIESNLVDRKICYMMTRCNVTLPEALETASSLWTEMRGSPPKKRKVQRTAMVCSSELSELFELFFALCSEIFIPSASAPARVAIEATIEAASRAA